MYQVLYDLDFGSLAGNRVQILVVNHLILQVELPDIQTQQGVAFPRDLAKLGATIWEVFTEYYHQLDRMNRIHDWVVKYTLGGMATERH